MGHDFSALRAMNKTASDANAMCEELLRDKIAHMKEALRLRELLRETLPALEKAHAMTAGGPKKSDALALLNRVRQEV